LLRLGLRAAILASWINDPGNAENVHLHEGDVIAFGPEHIADISTPPREYVIEKYGASFFYEQR
jgi:hypothetical protein